MMRSQAMHIGGKMLGRGAILKRFVAALTGGLMMVTASSAVSATYGDWDVSSDAGTYSPIVLGDTISLDACGSSLFQLL